MINTNIGRLRMRLAIEERSPGARDGITIIPDFDVIAVAAEHEFARITVRLALDRAPVREQVPVVAPVVLGR